MPLDACYSLDQTLRLLSIPSPTGYPVRYAGALVETPEGLGFSSRAAPQRQAWCAPWAARDVLSRWLRMWTRWG